MRCSAAIQSLLLCLAVGATAGCGESEDQFAVHPVRGEVTYRGKPAEGAKVVFYATERRSDRLPFPTGDVQEDGRFELTSYKQGDGAPSGTYNVAITWPEPIPAGANKEVYSPRDRLRGRYAKPEESGLQAVVAEGENTLQPFRLE